MDHLRRDEGEPADDSDAEWLVSQQLEALFETRLSITSYLISWTQAAAILMFVVATPLYGLAAIDALSDEYLPRRIQQATFESGVNVWVRLVYLVGPVTGVISIAIYRFIKTLERIVILKGVARRVDDAAIRRLINESMSLLEERQSLAMQDCSWEPGDPVAEAYVAAVANVERNKRQLLGAMPTSLLALVSLVAFNWFAVGLQVYYGVQWAFVSKWLSIPVLCVWCLGLLLATRSLFGKRA